MSRLDRFAPLALASSLALIVVAVAACGGDSADTADAAPIMLADSRPPDATPPDAAGPPPCEGTVCDGVCIDTDTDEANCGDCGEACQGGAACGGGDCTCVEGFVPATITGDQVLDGAIAGFPGVTVGLMFTTDIVVVGVDAETVVGTPYDLSASTINNPPFVGAGKNVELVGTGITTEGSFAVTAGTLTFTEICEGRFVGTITDATFSGVTNLLNPVPTKDSCTFTVPEISFRFGSTTECPAPALR